MMVEISWRLRVIKQPLRIEMKIPTERGRRTNCYKKSLESKFRFVWVLSLFKNLILLVD